MSIYKQLPPLQNEVIFLGLPCIDFDSPKSRESQLMNPHGARYVFTVTYKDYLVEADDALTSGKPGIQYYSFVETLCTIAVLTDHLATKLHTSIIG